MHQNIPGGWGSWQRSCNPLAGVEGVINSSKNPEPLAQPFGLRVSALWGFASPPQCWFRSDATGRYQLL